MPENTLSIIGWTSCSYISICFASGPWHDENLAAQILIFAKCITAFRNAGTKLPKGHYFVRVALIGDLDFASFYSDRIVRSFMVKEWPNPANNFDFFVDAALFDAHRGCKAKGSRARVNALLAALPFLCHAFFSPVFMTK
jgi:hypothetical protein